jgi:hypothetical protein
VGCPWPHRVRESEAAIGQLVTVDALLADLRRRLGIDTYLKLPPGPNFGAHRSVSADPGRAPIDAGRSLRCSMLYDRFGRC